MNEPNKLLLTVEEGARMVGLGRSKFYDEVLSGHCESITIGRRRLIPVQALESYVERLRAESNARAGAVGDNAYGAR